MGSRCQSDKCNGRPESRDARREKDRHHPQSANEHRCFSSSVDTPAVRNEGRRQPASGNAADVCSKINRYQRQSDVKKCYAVSFVEEIRNPEQVKPPEWIGHELPESDRPHLPILQQRAPWNTKGRLSSIGFDVCQLRPRKAFMLARRPVKP